MKEVRRSQAPTKRTIPAYSHIVVLVCMELVQFTSTMEAVLKKEDQ